MTDGESQQTGDPARPADFPIAIALNPAALREHVRSWRAAGETVALVPTMGALHAGHLSLVERARREARRVVVSIFVNPTQFAPSEDLDRYPRTFEQDCTLLAEANADLVYAPAVTDMYPEGFSTRVVPAGPAQAGLEDAARPHFFAGVATVVTKLLLQTLPDVALFGEKDFQQLRVIETVVRDFAIPVRIIGPSTVREADGLALSSRNRFLAAEERHRARLLFMALDQAAAAIRSGVPVERALAAARDELISVGAVVDYFEARDAETLASLTDWPNGRPARLLAAVRIGTTRLIDNVPL
jgi:pantoate--beta-alanine ligase